MGTDAQLRSGREVREEGQQKTQQERERRARPRKAWSDKNWWWAGMGDDFRRIIHTSQYCDFLSV